MCVKSAVLVPDLHSCQQVAVIPSSAQYRKNVEATVGAHIKVLEKESDVGRIEAEIGLGPLENVLGMAEDELELATQVCECDSCLCVGIRRGRRVVVCVLTRAVCQMQSWKAWDAELSLDVKFDEANKSLLGGDSEALPGDKA